MGFRNTLRYWQLALAAGSLTALPVFAGEQTKECDGNLPSPPSECVLMQMSHRFPFPPPPESFFLPPPPPFLARPLFSMSKEDLLVMEGLSEAQKEQLIALQDSFEVSTAVSRAELKQNLHKMLELICAAEIDKEEIQKVKKRLDELEKELSDRHIEMSIKRATIFSAEQRRHIRQKMLMRFLGESSGRNQIGFPGHL